MSNWDEVMQQTPTKVQESVRRGIPTQLRGHMWMSLTSSTILKHNHPKLYKQCLMARDGNKDRTSNTRSTGDHHEHHAADTRPVAHSPTLSSSSSSSSSSRRSKSPRPVTPNNVRETREETISRDVGRTFPKHQQFRDSGGLGQRSLYHVLRAYSVLDPTVGYCQGMGYVVALLLTTMCEESAFWTMVSLMQSTKYSMAGLFRTGLPRLQLYQHMLERLLRERQQQTAEHLFDELGVIPSSFAPQWIMTIFTSSFPLNTALRVWDVFLNEGWPFMFQVMMAMMELASPQLLSMSNFEDALKLLCYDFPRSVPLDMLLETSFRLTITHQEFVTLEEQSVDTLSEHMERSEMMAEEKTSSSVYSIPK